MTDDPPPRVGYAGLVTRAVALGLDALAINGIAILTGGAVNLIASALGHHGSISPLEAVLGGAAWIAWSVLYFATFWTLTGQTPGDRLMGIRVFSEISDRIRIRQAVLRFGALLLAALPLGAGFLPVLTDDRRRGLHDKIAKTVVRWDEGEEVLAVAAPPVIVKPMAALPVSTSDPDSMPDAGQLPTA
jgi:uncharacterized RDD family membrane protein YckC